MRWVFPALLLALSLAFAALPRPTGYVNDFAGILPDAGALENGLRMYERNTSVEIAVVTMESVPPGYTLFSYGVELFEEWGIGKRGEDNGLLVLLVKNGTAGSRMRIEVGYGLQGYITGAEAGRILDEALPFYTRGDYQKSVEIILEGLSAELEDYAPDASRKDNYDIFLDAILPNLPLIVLVSFIAASALLSNRCPYCLRGRIRCEGGYCTCLRCGRRFRKHRRFAPVLIGGSGGSSGGGFGGFGGGSSGGGGAGR